MVQFRTRFVLPDVIYHGTTMRAILNPEGFKKQLINESFMQSPWSNNKDFGTGLYTTIDFRQASIWARKRILSTWRSGIRIFPEEDLPIIVEIKCVNPVFEKPVDVLDFRGECDMWSDFILVHRYQSSLNDCSCRSIFGHDHPKIVCGPMADNDTGSVIADFIADNRSFDVEEDRVWFREQITQTEQGFRRIGLELGDQIAWFGEDLNSFLRYNGYYKLNINRFLADSVNEANYREEWDYYGDHEA